MRHHLRRLRLVLPILAGAVTVLPHPAASEGLFDFLFGNSSAPSRPAAQVGSSYPDQYATQGGPASPAPQPRSASVSGGGSGFCVRTCDGKYFPVVSRGGSTPAQMCQAFCPASATKVFYGGNIEGAATSGGERYSDLPNAYAYRKALRADCTCNGRDPAGLAPVDLAADTTLRAGDIVATSDGLVAYSGIRLGQNQAPDFTPVNDYPGLTAEVRARLGEMKVAPVHADTAEDQTELMNARAAMPRPDAVASKTAPRSPLKKSMVN